MKKICLLIWIVCLSICSISLLDSSVNATEVSEYDKLEEIYQNECERKIEQNNYYESLVSKIQEDWLIEDEKGRMYWAITDEEISQIDTELVTFLNQSMTEKNQLIDDSLIIQTSDGDIALSDEIENNYYVQSGDIEFVQRYKKLWFLTIWIGFDMICNNAVAAITISTIGILLDVVGIITDISILWKAPDVIGNILETTNLGLAIYARELGATLETLPKLILSGVEAMYKAMFGISSGIFGLVLSGLKLGFPKTVEAMDIIKHAGAGHGVKFTYTAIFYSGYTLL